MSWLLTSGNASQAKVREKREKDNKKQYLIFSLPALFYPFTEII